MTVAYIADVRSDAVVVREADDELRSRLSSFTTRTDDPTCIVIPVSGEADIPGTLERLRDLGVGFVAGTHGWPPSAVFSELREKGLVRGGFVEVTFAGPGKRENRNR